MQNSSIENKNKFEPTKPNGENRITTRSKQFSEPYLHIIKLYSSFINLYMFAIEARQSIMLLGDT